MITMEPRNNNSPTFPSFFQVNGEVKYDVLRQKEKII